jgi:hypothetical protein
LQGLHSSSPAQAHLTGKFARFNAISVVNGTVQLGTVLAFAQVPLSCAVGLGMIPARTRAGTAASIAVVHQQHRLPPHAHHVDPIVSDNATQVMPRSRGLACPVTCVNYNTSSQCKMAKSSALVRPRLDLLSGYQWMWQTPVCLLH